MVSKILGRFLNTWTADDKYSLRKSGHLRQPIQMQLCKKQKTFYQVFRPLLKSTSNFQHFRKKDDLHR